MSKKEKVERTEIVVGVDCNTEVTLKNKVKELDGKPYVVVFKKPYPPHVNEIARACVKLGCQVRQEA